MTATAVGGARSARRRGGRTVIDRRRREISLTLHRAGLSSQFLLCMSLIVLTVGACAAMLAERDWFPPSTLLLIVLLGGYVLRLRPALVLAGVVLAELAFLVAAKLAVISPGALAVQLLGVLAVLLFVRSRDRLGLQGVAGDLMIVDLRDRLQAHGRIPPLPSGWRVDSALRSANAEAFSGDFVVAARGEGGRLLEIALVDVSGKGQDAGVRSLLLSGAFGGLLGAMPRRVFLTAANEYLLGQDWAEGFATAVHVAVRLDTGEYWIATAGHPPAVHVHAGSGRQELVDTIGAPALGVVASPRYTPHFGHLERGDTLMLYTDGMVETPGDDVDLGIDRLMGVVERVVATRSGGAEAVLAAMRAGEGDDRALVLLHRD